MRCGKGIKLFTSSVMWAVWTEEESHETKVQFRPLAYYIFHNTDVKPSKKKFWKKVGKNILEKKFLEKNFRKKILEKKFEKNVRNKIPKQKYSSPNFIATLISATLFLPC